MVWYLVKQRHIDQWHRIESKKIDPHISGQLISNKIGKTIQRTKDSLVNKLVLQTLGIYMKK